MKSSAFHVPSDIVADEKEAIRQQSFTRWMSRDLLQAATDFCRNIGLHAIYSECSSDDLIRCIFWRPPQDAGFEVRSGRTRDQFDKYDQVNRERGWMLLSLHVNERDLYSAVWISPDHHATAAAQLAVYGITPADEKT